MNSKLITGALVTLFLAFVIRCVVYFNDTKCYDVRVHAERDDQSLDLHFEIPNNKRLIDPAVRQLQAMVPKSMGITRVETSVEGRGWMCGN